MTQRNDIKGMTFGRLTVIEQRGVASNRSRMWACLCACGSEVVVIGSSLKNGNTKSCGCLRKERLLASITTHGFSGGRRGPQKLYRIWRNMKSRCNNKNTPKFKNHGGRGISICKEWNSYENFHRWAVSNGYSDTLTIDRRDNNEGYSPENCRWVTARDQGNNKRTNHLVTIGRTTKTITEWCDGDRKKAHAIYGRINRYGWTPEKALLTPIRPRSMSI